MDEVGWVGWWWAVGLQRIGMGGIGWAYESQFTVRGAWAQGVGWRGEACSLHAVEAELQGIFEAHLLVRFRGKLDDAPLRNESRVGWAGSVNCLVCTG